MSKELKEGMSFEAGVNTITKDTEGNDWLQLTWYSPVKTEESEPGATPPPQAPVEHCSIYVLASSLPGVKYGDKVQVALYPK